MEFPTPEVFTDYASSTGRTYVSISLEHNGEDLGSMVLELYTDLCPRTCENFVKGVSGFTGGMRYLGSPIHRIVKHAFIQGGDVVDGTGKGNPGWTIADETFCVKHDAPGIIGMANNAEPHTASTQFYITFNALPWLDGKRVAFGKVIDEAGFQLLEKVSDLPTNNERPLPEVHISKIEVLYPK